MTLPSGLLAISLLAGATVFILVVASGSVLLERQILRARAKAVSGAGNRGRSRDETKSLQRLVLGALRGLTARVNLLRDQQFTHVRKSLVAAGWRSRDAATIYLSCKIGLPFVIGLPLAVWLLLFEPLDLPILVRIIAALTGALVGSYAPDLVIRNATSRRTKTFRKALPDALDLLVICAEAGLSFTASLERVAKELAQGNPKVAEELSYTVLELRFSADRRGPLENLADRIALPAVRALVNTLLQSEKYGTPLAKALRVLAAELREERMMRAEEKAARLPVLMTIPLILFIFPALFVVIIGPAIIDIVELMRR